MRIKDTNINISIPTGLLLGEEILNSKKTISDLKGVFKNEEARKRIEGNELVYQVHAYDPEMVIIGGGILSSHDIILPFIQKQSKKFAWTP